MKVILAATAALLLSTATIMAEETKMQPGEPSTGDAGKSTNSDGSPGTNPASKGTAINQSKNTGSDPSAGKSTNSDGTSGATGASSGEGGSPADSAKQ